MLLGQCNRIRLRHEPFAPVELGLAILRQEHGITIGTTKRATDIRVARPCKATTPDKACGFAKNAAGDDVFHRKTKKKPTGQAVGDMAKVALL